MVIPTNLFAEYFFHFFYSVIVKKNWKPCYLSYVRTRSFHIFLISTDSEKIEFSSQFSITIAYENTSAKSQKKGINSI